MIINLHGLNSAGNNTAYKYLKSIHDEDIKIFSPSYTVHNFKTGIDEIENTIDFSDEKEQLMFVATSTGALFAEYLANKYNSSVVLINPVVDPRQLRQFIGHNKNFKTGKEYEITEADILSFPQNNLGQLTRTIFIEIYDTVLDHKITIERYKNKGKIVKFPGNNHRFSYWPEIMPEIINFYHAIID
jgi:predicted esterase YcpF (UPF0227 family)